MNIMLQQNEQEKIKELEKRIAYLEQERKMNRKPSIWADIKKEIQDDCNEFKWIDKWSFTDCNDKLVQKENKIYEGDTVASAIGTLIRCTLKKKRIALLEESDREKASRIAHSIVEIIKNEF